MDPCLKTLAWSLPIPYDKGYEGFSDNIPVHSNLPCQHRFQPEDNYLQRDDEMGSTILNPLIQHQIMRGFNPYNMWQYKSVVLVHLSTVVVPRVYMA